jgi:type III pantothenate kinase
MSLGSSSPCKPFVLAVDVGNTSIAFGLFKGKKLVRRHRCLTHAFKPSNLKPFARHKGKISEAIICSVVPGANARLEAALKKALGSRLVLLGRDRRVPIANKTAKPKQVGMDRLVNAWAAWQRFRRPCVVVDFGTATTFDVVSGKGEYLGGVIAPGVQLTLNALAEKTALLPKIQLKAVSRVVGNDTISSIRSGCAYGLGALCDGVIQKIERQSGSKHRVIATGGHADFMQKYTTRLENLDNDFTLNAIAQCAA